MAFSNSCTCVKPVLMEIAGAEVGDAELMRELISMEYGECKLPLGVLLVPSQMQCVECGRKLLL